jgi:predicted hotdog family 3-hydroxylacyl-ACP dehydratase
MSDSFPSVTDLLPHKEPMILIDEIISFSKEEKKIEVSVLIKEENIFYDKNIEGVSNLISIEYMAQASAALAEMSERLKSQPSNPRPGMLLGTRKLNLSLEKFERGKKYFISAKDVFDDGVTASFDCEIRSEDGIELASASLTAYRPEDFAGFLKERVNV